MTEEHKEVQGQIAELDEHLRKSQRKLRMVLWFLAIWIVGSAIILFFPPTA